MAISAKYGNFEAVALAADQGALWARSFGSAVLNLEDDEVLYEVLDSLFQMNPTFWCALIDAAGADAIDAAFYAGAYIAKK